jgi:hypothetical protein
MDKPMTLEQVSRILRTNPRYGDLTLANAIDAHLAREPVRVTDEDVDQGMDAAGRISGGLLTRSGMRAAPESFAASLPVAAKVPDALEVPPPGASINHEVEIAYVDGWNACREAMIAQSNGGVREHLSLQEAEDEVRQLKEAFQDAWTDFEVEFLTNGSGYASISQYNACCVAFTRAFQVSGTKAAREAAIAMLAAAKQPAKAEGK